MSQNPRCDRSKKVANSDPTWGLYSTGMTLLGRMVRYATYPEFVADPSKPDFAYVVDATGDPTVGSGAAIYKVNGRLFEKIWEEEAGPGPGPGGGTDRFPGKAIIIHSACAATAEVNTRYVTDNDVDLTTPLTSKQGEIITISIRDGGENSTITPAAGQTLNGSTETVALNAAGMTYYFTYDEENHNWIQFN